MTLTDEQLDQWELGANDFRLQVKMGGAVLALIAEVRRLRKIETAARDYLEATRNPTLVAADAPPYVDWAHLPQRDALAAALQEAEKPQ